MDIYTDNEISKNSTERGHLNLKLRYIIVIHHFSNENILN